MVIDVHAHYYPRRYLEYIGRPELPPLAAAALANQTIDERLDLLDRVGVDTQALSASQAQPYLPEARRASEAARMLNDLSVELEGHVIVTWGNSSRRREITCDANGHSPGTSSTEHRRTSTGRGRPSPRRGQGRRSP